MKKKHNGNQSSSGKKIFDSSVSKPPLHSSSKKQLAGAGQRPALIPREFLAERNEVLQERERIQQLAQMEKTKQHVEDFSASDNANLS